MLHYRGSLPYVPKSYKPRELERFQRNQHIKKAEYHRRTSGIVGRLAYAAESKLMTTLEHIDKLNDHRRFSKHFGYLEDSLKGAYYCELVDEVNKNVYLGEIFIGKNYICFKASRSTLGLTVPRSNSNDKENLFTNPQGNLLEITIPFQEIDAIVKAGLRWKARKRFPRVVPLKWNSNPKVFRVFTNRGEVFSWTGFGPSLDDVFFKATQAWAKLSEDRTDGLYV